MQDSRLLPDKDIAARGQELERWLLTEFGPVLSGLPLSKLLGHPSSGAFRQAVRRHGAPVALFQQGGRKGWCAATKEVALWIARTEAAAQTLSTQTPPENTP